MYDSQRPHVPAVTPTLFYRFLSLVCAPILIGAAVSPLPAFGDQSSDLLEREFAAAAPHANPAAIDVATRAMACAMRTHLVEQPRTLSLIDYSLPSSQPRLWVFDVAQHRLLFEELVAHGRNSGGEGPALHFSNVDGSLMSSLGVFRTSDTYTGHNGYSLRLEGLDSGFNDHALQRAVVIHGAWYVSPEMAKSQGRIGRSWGCPAVRPTIARELIDAIRGGSLVVAYYPDQTWLSHSALVGSNCDLGGSVATNTVSDGSRLGSSVTAIGNSPRGP